MSEGMETEVGDQRLAIPRWHVQHWVNINEYIVTTTIAAKSVEQDGVQAVIADGVRIEFEEPIEAISKA